MNVKKEKRKKTSEDDGSEPSKNLIIVGIGASAGGLEALQELLVQLPESKNTAYIIAQHISPTHKSMMAGILQKNTKLPVLEPENGAAIQPASIYITPPNTNIFIEDDCFELKAPGASVILPKPSIDLFFTSLAKAKGERAVGIILSGTGTDGRLGMSAIKTAGGITLAQDPKTAKYDSMPLASIENQLVDIVSTPHEMGDELTDIFAWLAGKSEIRPSQAQQSDLMIILGLVKQYHGVDFSQYKTNTVFRRIKRRMLANGTEVPGDYIRILHESPEEVKTLYTDLLIGVTSFFRDPESWGKLRQALEESLEERPVDEPPENFRAWVVGCSTGEEAYTLAMVLCEVFDRNKTAISIFASDIDANSIQHARNGRYLASALKNVPQELVDKYFQHDGTTEYRATKFIRDVILFSNHDVTRDPPFSKIDLLSCRNLLIYFNVDLQRRVLRALTFSLKTGGFLFLGASETLADYADAYTNVFREQKIFQKIVTPEFKTQFYAGAGLGSRNAAEREQLVNERPRRPEELMQDALLTSIGNHFLPLSVIVNEAQTVVYSREKNPYLSLPAGASNLTITKMVPPEMELDLRTTMHAVSKSGEAQSSRFMNVALANGETRLVRITAMPLSGRREDSKMMIVSFQEERPERMGLMMENLTREQIESDDVERLQFELDKTKTQLQSVIEELETSNEELQATNEELQSTNEELQSTNEELETANEELQSTNEEVQVAYNELQIVSDEHKNQRALAEKVSDHLREREELLTSISDSAMDGIMAFQAVRDETTREIVDFEYIFCNSVGGDIIGWDSEELIGHQLLVEMPGNKTAGLFDLYRDVVNNRKRVTHQFYYNHDGLKHWFDLVALPYEDGFVVTFSDITERKKHEEYVALEKARLEIAAHSANIGIWEWDVSQQCFYCNEIFLGQLRSEKGALGSIEEWFALAGPEEGARLKAVVKGSIDKGAALDEVYSIRFENDEQHFALRSQVVLDENGNPVRVVGTQMNVSTLQELRLGLSEYKLKARESTRSKDQFMANVSHEMRTPIHGIMGSAQLLESGSLDEVQRKYVENIKKSSSNLSRIVDDVLDMSKARANQLELETIDFLLADVLRDAMEPGETTAGSKGVSLDWDVDETVPPVLVGDSFRLCQILINLVSNAVKFTEDGGSVSVHVQPIEGASEGFLAFSVRDTGIGIEPEHIEHLFEPFSQVDASMSRRFGGTGLGLAIAAELVDLMGGEISVDSTPGKGSTFRFTARFGIGDSRAKLYGQQRESPDLGEKDVKSVLEGKRVLVVEDDTINATVVMELLRAAGVDPTHTEDGRQALDELKGSKTFDAVLMDCQMPVMDGYEATRQLRKWNRFKSLPVIALTANAYEEDRAKVLEAGMNDFLAKPFEKDKLYELIARWIAGS